MIAILQPTEEQRIPDLGCGTHRHALELRRRGYSVVGAELLESNVKVARESATGIELIDQRWNARTRCLEGTADSITVGEVFDPVPVRKRLYSVQELTEIYASYEMTLSGLFRGNGRAGKPRNTQFELSVVASKASADGGDQQVEHAALASAHGQHYR